MVSYVQHILCLDYLVKSETLPPHTHTTPKTHTQLAHWSLPQGAS